MIESESYAPTAKDRFVHKADATKPTTMQPSQMTVPGKLPCSDDGSLDDRQWNFTSQRLRWPERPLSAVSLTDVPIGSAQCCALENVSFEPEMTNAAQGMIGRAVALVEHLPCDKFYYLCMRA